MKDTFHDWMGPTEFLRLTIPGESSSALLQLTPEDRENEFTENVRFYEVHNSGAWYDFGFVLGAGILFGGSRGVKRR